jgi:hypothetical protein
MRTQINTRPAGILVALAALGGCARQTPVEEQHPVSWYVEHPAERTETIGWCSEDVVRGSTPNCVNAEQAVEKIATKQNAPNISSGARIP